jgi:hypothetical protein
VIIGVVRFPTARPVARFRGEIRAGTCVDVAGNVERLLWAEALCAIDRHQRVNERSGGVDSRHSGSNVVRAGTPKWGREGGAGAVRAVATCARGCKNASPTLGVAAQRLKPRETLALHLYPDRHSARQKGEIRDYVTHVPAPGCECAAIHASPEAVVDPVLDEIDFAASGAVLRESGEGANPGHGVATQATVQVTTGAAERITDVMWKAVACRQKERAPPKRGCPVHAVFQLIDRRNPKGNARLCGLLRKRGRFRLTNRRHDCREQGREQDTDSDIEARAQQYLRVDECGARTTRQNITAGRTGLSGFSKMSHQPFPTMAVVRCPT